MKNESVGLRGAQTIGDKRVSSLMEFSWADRHKTTFAKPDTLLPCPFCGGRGEIAHRSYQSSPSHRESFVVCRGQNCGAVGPWTDTGDRDAISMWNKRAALTTAKQGKT